MNKQFMLKLLTTKRPFNFYYLHHHCRKYSSANKNEDSHFYNPNEVIKHNQMNPDNTWKTTEKKILTFDEKLKKFQRKLERNCINHVYNRSNNAYFNNGDNINNANDNK
jgi:hypothetical protein